MSPLHSSRRRLCLLPSRSLPHPGPRGALRGADCCVLLTGWAPPRLPSVLVTREPVLSTPPRPARTAIPAAPSQEDSPSLVLTFALRCQGGPAGRKPGALCLQRPTSTHLCLQMIVPAACPDLDLCSTCLNPNPPSSLCSLLHPQFASTHPGSFLARSVVT